MEAVAVVAVAAIVVAVVVTVVEVVAVARVVVVVPIVTKLRRVNGGHGEGKDLQEVGKMYGVSTLWEDFIHTEVKINHVTWTLRTKCIKFVVM